MKNKSRLIALAIVTISLIVYGCSKEDDIANDNNSGKQAAIEKTSLFEAVPKPETTNSTEGGIYTDMVDFESEAIADTPIVSSVDVIKSGTSPYPISGSTNGTVKPGILTAGEWNDLENWVFWNELLNDQDYFKEVNKWNLKNVKRYSFEVLDQNNSKVANAQISLLVNGFEVWKTKTDNQGTATLWSALEFNSLQATITIGNQVTRTIDVKEYAKGINKIVFNIPIINKKMTDIYFAVDATGSMGDEINYLKEELNHVIETVKEKNPSLGMRFGSVFYRDKTDLYVTRDLGFTTDVSSLTSFIAEQFASGGGDYPEAVHSALDVAITQNSWNDEASSRILFLLLDAPPHYTQESISSLEKSIHLAAEKGIKIIPIAASGIDKPTEYLMRTFAILTNGTYVFITDDSGVGNSHIKPTIGDYEVQKLNDLLINLIDSYVK